MPNLERIKKYLDDADKCHLAGIASGVPLHGQEAFPEVFRFCRELATEVERLRAAIEFIRKYADETHDYWDAGSDATVGKRLLAMAGELAGYNAELDKALS